MGDIIDITEGEYPAAKRKRPEVNYHVDLTSQDGEEGNADREIFHVDLTSQDGQEGTADSDVFDLTSQDDHESITDWDIYGPSTSRHRNYATPASPYAEDGDDDHDGDSVIFTDEPSTSKYGDYVTPAELDKLREFQILDEAKSNDGDSNDEDSDSDGKSEVPDEEIERMLDEDLPEEFKGAPKRKEKPYVMRQKIVLQEKGVNLFEVLPLDWMMVRHVSGIPLYMHRHTRVCTLAKPYALGKGNTRKHEIPISAIPCLAYRRALEEEEKQKKIDETIAEQIRDGTWAENTDTTNSQSNSNTEDMDFSVDIDVDVPPNVIQSPQVPPNPPKESETQDNIGEGTFLGRDNQAKKVTNSEQDPAESVFKCPFPPTSKSIFQHSATNVTQNQPIENDNSDKNNESNDEHYYTDQSTSDDQTENDDQHGSNESNEKEANKSDRDKIPLNRRPVVLPGGIVMPPPRVEAVNTSWKTQHLTPEQINDYCKTLFKFKTYQVKHFKRWSDRRKYTKARKAMQYPNLPKGTKVISIPANTQNPNDHRGKTKRDWVMNMNGSSYLSGFHEYVWRTLHKQPVYEFKQVENASCPYQATVLIGGMRYGVGHGSSKRQAKAAAARASIQILIPEMQEHLEPDPKATHEPDFSFFDYIGIEDPRVQEFCAAAAEPSPHAILRTCLQRNFGAQDRHVNTSINNLEYQQIQLTMSVGKHSATVICKNKREAKQRASQALLQKLHPQLHSWGSLLRLYGSRSIKSCKEKKSEEQEITMLQDKAVRNQPNHAVLAKLRSEMRKLKARDEAVVPIGTLMMSTDDLPQHSASNLNTVQL